MNRILILILIFLFFYKYFELNHIILLGILSIILFNYNKFNKLIDNSIKDIEINSNNNLKTSNISNILKDIKKYKKYKQYKNGKKYFKKFMKNIKLLEDNNMINYNQIFDNAIVYLNESIQYFKSIGFSIKEKSRVDLLYENSKYMKEFNDINELSDNLYKEGYNILYNLSIILNKKWEENPNIFNKQIILDYPLEKGVSL
tara:strand:+ start:1034 stop:1636 length:603 start_codon:yes stop_codon:yes gene_type:complete